MAVITKSTLVTLLGLLLSLYLTVSADSPMISPVPSPLTGDDSISLPPETPSPSLPPAPAPDTNPAPVPALGLSPSTSPDGPAADEEKPTPSPEAPSDAGSVKNVKAENEQKEGGGGMSGGKKAGIALGVIAAVGLVAVAAFVYKKRQQNIRRSEYGYAARRDIL